VRFRDVEIEPRREKCPSAVARSNPGITPEKMLLGRERRDGDGCEWT